MALVPLKIIAFMCVPHGLTTHQNHSLGELDVLYAKDLPYGVKAIRCLWHLILVNLYVCTLQT